MHQGSLTSPQLQIAVAGSLPILPSAACGSSQAATRAAKLTPAPIRHFRAFKGSQAARISAIRGICLASAEEPSLQLATAKLPQSINLDTFKKRMYDWASTLTSSGRNMPLSLPLRTKQTSEGFEMALLRISNGEPVPVATIATTIEEVEGTVSLGSLLPSHAIYEMMNPKKDLGDPKSLIVPKEAGLRQEWKEHEDEIEFSAFIWQSKVLWKIQEAHAAFKHCLLLQGNIFFVRFYEGRGASLVRTGPLPSDPYERLKTVINGLVDIPMIMSTMKTAIRQAASQSVKE